MPRDMMTHYLAKRSRHPINKWQYTTLCNRTVFARGQVTKDVSEVSCLNCQKKLEQPNALDIVRKVRDDRLVQYTSPAAFARKRKPKWHIALSHSRLAVQAACGFIIPKHGDGLYGEGAIYGYGRFPTNVCRRCLRSRCLISLMEPKMRRTKSGKRIITTMNRER